MVILLYILSCSKSNEEKADIDTAPSKSSPPNGEVSSPAQTSHDKTNEGNKEEKANSCNVKNKTPMCLVNELSFYNKVKFFTGCFLI